MRGVWETIAVAFAMFSALPVPQPVWEARNLRYALCAFPLIGLVVGALWWGWAALCGALSLPVLGQAAGLCLLPVLVTGGIHLDGYADTCDALASHAPPEKKQEIMKDPRCGAFAAMRLCTYFVAYFSLCGLIAIDVKYLIATAISFVFSRTLSGLAVAVFPLAKNTGLAHTFATAADRKRVGGVLVTAAVLLTVAACVLCGLAGGAMCAVGLLVFWHYFHVASKEFGGVSGDLAGWFLQRAELWMLVALVVCQQVGSVL